MWIIAIFILLIIVIGLAYWRDFKNDKIEFKATFRIALKRIVLFIFCIIVIDFLKILFNFFLEH